VYSDQNLRLDDVAGLHGLTIAQLLGVDDIPKPKLACKYVCVKPLVRHEKIPLLPTQMRKLHELYEKITKQDRNYLMVEVRKDHHYREDSTAIQIEELLQLFNLNALNKSIVCSYRF
jgi:hypothetical protein